MLRSFVYNTFLELYDRLEFFSGPSKIPLKNLIILIIFSLIFNYITSFSAVAYVSV